MKKIEFGFDISDNPIGSFQGIGINNIPEGPITAELLGIITIKGEDYLIGRTTDAFKNDPKYINKIIARKVLAEKFPDGSGILYLNKEEDASTKTIEEVLQTKNIKEDSLRKIVNKDYDSVIAGKDIAATAIRSDVFNRKKMLQENNKDKKEVESVANY